MLYRKGYLFDVPVMWRGGSQVYLKEYSEDHMSTLLIRFAVTISVIADMAGLLMFHSCSII
jgi:hypothetical protein